MKIIFRDLIVLIFLISIIVFLWFHEGLIFAGGEEGIPFYDLNKTAELVSYSWLDISGGYPSQLIINRIPYFSFLKSIYLMGIPSFLVQAFHFFIIMIFGTVSFYFLMRETVGKELETKSNKLFVLVPLVAAIFYLLNPFSMNQIWGRGLYLQFFPFALFPFFLLMFIKGLNKKNFFFGSLGLLASVFLAGSFGNPSYILSLWIIIFSYLLYYIYRNRSFKEILFSVAYFLFMFIGWIAVQMWWIYPFIKVSSNQFSAALSNWDQNIGTLKGVSKDYLLPNLLRLIHAGYYYRDQLYGGSYLSVPFFLLSWLIPLIALFSYRTFKNLKIFLFFGGLFLLALFICLGANLPTGWLFIFIFKTFPAFQSFRNPFEKFGLVLTMAYAPFFAIGAAVVSHHIGKMYKMVGSSLIALLTLLFLVFGVFLWPIWTGQFAGGVIIHPWVKVPDYYKDLDDWLNEQKDDGRIFHLPINPGDGLRYSGWEYPYQGIEPGEYIFTRPSIGKNGQGFKLYYNVLLERFNNLHPNSYGPDPDISNSEFRSDHLYEEMAKLNVRYIILHRDIDPKIGELGSPEPVIQYLDNQKNIKKVNTFGKLDVYEVEIPEEVQLIYSPDAKITYSKISPALYSINVDAAKLPFDLYFLQNFDANWEAYVDNEQSFHQTVFSYANKWTIDKQENFNMNIKYKPQDYVEEGMKITKITVLGVSLICLFYLLHYLNKIIRYER